MDETGWLIDGPAQFPIGTPVRKVSGPQWQGVVVGYYASSFTPEGLVIECTVEGALGQVHVEPAKRMVIAIERGDHVKE